PPHLNLPLKHEQQSINQPLVPIQHGPAISGKERRSPYNVRSSAHLIERSKELPHRMKAEAIIFLSESERSQDFRSLLRRTHQTVMMRHLFGKCACSPTF